MTLSIHFIGMLSGIFAQIACTWQTYVYEMSSLRLYLLPFYVTLKQRVSAKSPTIFRATEHQSCNVCLPLVVYGKN